MKPTPTNRPATGRWRLWLVWGLALAAFLLSCWVSQRVAPAGAAVPGRLALALVGTGAVFSFFSVYLFTTRHDS